jgi:hypothetical protein
MTIDLEFLCMSNDRTRMWRTALALHFNALARVAPLSAAKPQTIKASGMGREFGVHGPEAYPQTWIIFALPG